MGNEIDIPSEIEAVSGSVKVGFEEIEENFEIEDVEEEEKTGNDGNYRRVPLYCSRRM